MLRRLWIIATICLVAASAFAGTALQMSITYYDDGIACPGGCDSHVVFAKGINGTLNAFAPPMANRTNPADHPCQANGGACIICFADDDASCMETIYRGAGPPVGRFDVTPAFLAQHCGDVGAPDQLVRLCNTLSAGAKKYLNKVNCIVEPTADRCVKVITDATAAYEADLPEYAKCIAAGSVEKYNNSQLDVMKHRSNTAGCEYSQNLKEHNASGVTWQRLLPAACRKGNFVGRWGTDCCTGVPLADASFGGGECDAFYR